LHAIDLNLFNPGACESVKTGGKGNVDRRAFADAEIFDQMRVGGSSGGEAKPGNDGQR